MTVQTSRISTEIVAFLALGALVACGDSNNGETESNNGVIIITDDSNNGTTANNGPNNGGNNVPNNGANNGETVNNVSNNGVDPGVNANCPPEARPVYVVEADEDPDGQGTLVRFDPKERLFTEIGALNCPANVGAQPFSMSVDRDATAWVLYSSGQLFEVSTTDASCASTDYQPGQNGYDVFGMGFVLNTPTTEAETLYVAGGSGPGAGDPRIGYITFPDLGLNDVTTIGGWPEMSGTAAAELWAFFPNPITGTARVSRIIPATGEEVESIPVDSLISGEPNAWAFAHWGGNFYLFYKSQTDESTNVFEVTRAGGVEEVIHATGRYIVGAGVSTCAPLIIL